MVCLTHATWFLSEAGVANFPNWFKELTTSLQKQAGFISICYAKDPDHQSEMHVWIEFKDRDHLSSWLASPESKDLNKKLEPYQIQSQHMTHFKVIDAASAA